jgi:hypothetical protein
LLSILVAAGHLTPEEAGQQSMAGLAPEDLSTDEVVAELIELSHEIQRRVAHLQSQLDGPTTPPRTDVDDPKDPVGLEVPGIPNRRPRADAQRHLK